VMQPEFGCQIHDLISASADAATAALVEQYVEVALHRWEPRIQVLDVAVLPDPTTADQFLITVQYEIKATSQRSRLDIAF